VRKRGALRYVVVGVAQARKLFLGEGYSRPSENPRVSQGFPDDSLA